MEKMCSAKNLIPALAVAGAHGRRDSTGMALQVAAEKDCHHLWPGRGGVPPVQISWDHCLSDTSLLFLSIGRSGSVEFWRGGGIFLSFHSINVLDLLQRDMRPLCFWPVTPSAIQLKEFKERQKAEMVIYYLGPDFLIYIFINLAIWCAGAGFFTFYFRSGVAIEHICASI